MPIEILPSGSTAAASSDFIVDKPTTVHLKAAGGRLANNSRVNIEIKSSTGEYTNVGALTNASPVQVLHGPGAYRVERPPNGPAVGVERSS